MAVVGIVIVVHATVEPHVQVPERLVVTCIGLDLIVKGRLECGASDCVRGTKRLVSVREESPTVHVQIPLNVYTAVCSDRRILEVLRTVRAVEAKITSRKKIKFVSGPL